MGKSTTTSQYASIPPRRFGVADALFTSTQQKVLALLFGQPERTFYTAELIALAEAGSGAVQRELARLTEAGLITISRIGNQKHYQANQQSPIFEELRQIARKTFALSVPLKQALEPLAERIDLALVYGSQAKKSDTASSDIDLLVVADELTLEELFKALQPVEQESGRPVNPTLLTRKEFSRRRLNPDSFISRVIQGEVIPLIGSVDGQ
jgi:predicted nucleotidyltransferase